MLVVTPDVSLKLPGVIRADYPEGEAPMLPQVSSFNNLYLSKYLTKPVTYHLGCIVHVQLSKICPYQL